MINLTKSNPTKNAVELKKELNENGVSIEYITINGQKIGMFGSANEKDREAAVKALNAAYEASNGDIYEMMTKLTAIATMEEKEIAPDEMVEVCGVEIMISYSKAAAYTMDGEEIASCADLPSMPNEAIKAVLMARVETVLS